MKAVAVFPAEKRYGVIDAPEPGPLKPDEVRLRMLDVGICGTDKEIVAFEYGTPPAGSDYLIIGHESLGEVIEVGPAVTRLSKGDLAIPTVRRPCPHPECIPCRAGRQDFCTTGDFTERGIKGRHGFMAEFVVEQEQYLNRVPAGLRDIGVLVEPLTIAEKGVTQLWQVQQRLPWACPVEPGKPAAYCHTALVLGAGPVGLLGAMKLVLEGFRVLVYSKSGGSDQRDDVVKAIGAEWIAAEEVAPEKLGEKVGRIDLVYEAVGASALAFEVLNVLDANGVFVFTGVPGRRGPVSVDTDRLMRNLVLQNQIVFGTVNASLDSFASAIADLAEFERRWPTAVRQIITNRVPLEQAAVALSGQLPGIKNVIGVTAAGDMVT